MHSSLCVTPAQEADLTPSVWSVGELMEHALSTPEDVFPPPLPTYPLPSVFEEVRAAVWEYLQENPPRGQLRRLAMPVTQSPMQDSLP